MPEGTLIRHVHCNLAGSENLGLTRTPGTEPSIVMSLLSLVQSGSDNKEKLHSTLNEWANLGPGGVITQER